MFIAEQNWSIPSENSEILLAALERADGWNEFPNTL